MRSHVTLFSMDENSYLASCLDDAHPQEVKNLLV
jgi:hypothetical protein